MYHVASENISKMVFNFGTLQNLCYHKFYEDTQNTMISKMVFFCQARLTKTLSKQRKDNYPQGNLRINWKLFFFSSFFSKQKKFHRDIFSFYFATKVCENHFPHGRIKRKKRMYSLSQATQQPSLPFFTRLDCNILLRF